MNKVIQLHSPKTTEEVIASVLCDAEPVLVTYRFAFIPEAPKKAAVLRKTVLTKFPDTRHVETRKLVESCEDVEVVFETTLPASSAAYSERRNAMYQLAERCKAELWNNYVARNPISSREPSAPKGVKLMMRTEFLTDALELRMALVPYVLHWSDHSVNLCGEPDCPAKVNSMDRNVEFELADSAPSLDHLRWYINQIVDMHVAAQSLHYADRYTGRRLPYWLLDDMEPPVEVIEEMLKVAKGAAKWRGSRNCSLRGLVATLTKHLERLKSAA